MPANAYPHLVFATDATTLPRTELESLVAQVFGDREPAPSVEQGPLQAVVRLGDYAFTLWYDDDSEGLPGRYADFAPTLKRRRISRCTTMIDLSGDADPDGAHRDDARRLTETLAQRPGVYVFSEEAKAFVGMDEADPFADTLEPTTGRPEERVEEPARSAAESAAESVPTPEPLPEPDVVATPVDDATPADEPIVAQSVEMPVPVESAPQEAVETAPEPRTQPEPVEVQPEPVEAQAEPVEAQAEPARAQEEKEGGFFKRLFGRRR